MLGTLRLNVLEIAVIVLLGEDKPHVRVDLIVVFIFRFSRVLLADEDSVGAFGGYLHCDVV